MLVDDPEDSSHSEAFSVAYYNHQYDRVRQIEGQALSLTSIVITLVVLTFSFGFDAPTAAAQHAGLALLAANLVINVFAIAYIARSARLVDLHRRRALAILSKVSAQAGAVQRDTIDVPDGRLQRALHRLLGITIGERMAIQLIIHAIIIVILVTFLPVRLSAFAGSG